MKIDANPIDTVHRLKNAPRCHAKAKHTGERRKCPAVQGWSVCRVDGAGGRLRGRSVAPTAETWRAVARDGQRACLGQFSRAVFSV